MAAGERDWERKKTDARVGKGHDIDERRCRDLILVTPTVCRSARVRPRVTDGGGGKASDHDDDVGEGAERAIISPCETEGDHG